MWKTTCCAECKPPKRCVGCHAICKDYLEEKERQNEENKRMKMEKLKQGPALTMSSFVGTARKRTNRKNWKRRK